MGWSRKRNLSAASRLGRPLPSGSSPNPDSAPVSRSNKLREGLVSAGIDVHDASRLMSQIIHIARNGSPLGQYRSEQIKPLLTQGTLRETDMFFDEESREWLSMSRWAEPDVRTFGPNPTAQASEEASPETDDSQRAGRRRRSSGRPRDSKKPRKRNPTESALPGWIAALFAICIAAGLWAWAQNLGGQLTLAQKKNTELEETVAALKRQNSILLEMAPPGKIRGVITSEPRDGRLAVMSGVSVTLFRLDDLRSAILKVANNPTPVTEEEFSVLLTRFQASLPNPLSMSLSDSSGRFEMTVPEAGQYGILATAFKQGGGSAERLLWLMEFDSSDSPTPVMSLGENNAISLSEPSMRITPPRQ
jgi:hypothetical protein